jgi:hypothetical protein
MPDKGWRLEEYWNRVIAPAIMKRIIRGIRKNKDQLFRSHNAESRMEHPAFVKHLQGLVEGVRFGLTTFGLCDLTQLLLRIGLDLPRVTGCSPSSFYAFLVLPRCGSVLPSPQRASGPVDLDE